MTLPEDFDAQSPFPPGTTVVLTRDRELGGRFLKAGSQARVVRDAGPEQVHLLTLRGEALVAPRAALALQRGGPTPAADPLPRREAWEAYRGRIVLATLVGSRAWNLTDAQSDEDRRGCYLAPFTATASLQPPPPQIEDPAADGVYWELRKLIELGLRADPNLIEALYGPVLDADALGERILAVREAFLSRRVLGTFGRYALNQLERLQNRARRNRLMEQAAALWRAEPELSDAALVERLAAMGGAAAGRGARKARREARDVLRDLASSLCDRGLIPDRDPVTVRAFLAGTSAADAGWLDARADRPKNAMHLLRILHSGLSLLRGDGPLIAVPEGALRDELLAIKRGEVALEEVIARARELAAVMEDQAERSPLPDVPDRAAAEALLRAGRRAAHPWSGPRPASEAWPALPSQRDARASSPVPDSLLLRFLARRGERCLLATVSGSHAYGFPSADSDVDLKAIHLAPTRAVVGLGRVQQTASWLGDFEGTEVDFTSHELGKACRMLLQGDGNLLERVLGPYPVLEHARARELRALARRTLHRGYARHYLGFSRSLEREYRKGREEGAPRVKPLLYVFRAALTGAHLLRSGECDPDLLRNLERFPALARVRELVELKRQGDERAALPDDGPYLPLVEQAWALLAEAEAGSPLPAKPPQGEVEALSAWVGEVRLAEG